MIVRPSSRVVVRYVRVAPAGQRYASSAASYRKSSLAKSPSAAFAEVRGRGTSGVIPASRQALISTPW